MAGFRPKGCRVYAWGAMWGGFSVNASGRQREMPDQVGHDGHGWSGMTVGMVGHDGGEQVGHDVRGRSGGRYQLGGALILI